MPIAFIAMLPLAMITDPCHGDTSVDRVCRLTAAGQNLLVFVPFITIAGASVMSLAAAAIAAWRKKSPMIGVAFWVVGLIAMGYLANEIAYLV